MVATCKDFYRYMEFVIGHLGLWALSIQQKIPGWGSKISWGRMDRDGDRSRFISLSKNGGGHFSIRPVRPGDVVHLKRFTSFFETFPAGSNRSIEFWTEISGIFGWMDRALQYCATELWSSPSAKQNQNPCFGPPPSEYAPRLACYKSHCWFANEIRGTCSLSPLGIQNKDFGLLRRRY